MRPRTFFSDPRTPLVDKIIIFLLTTLINTPCTLYLLLMWPVLHGLVVFMVMMSEVAVVHGSHSKQQAHVQSDGLACQMTGSCSGLPIILLGSYLPGKPRNIHFLRPFHLS